jgi:hypothetical protein
LLKKVGIWTACIVVAGGIVFAGLRGCTAMPWNSHTTASGSATISITRDYGREVIRRVDVRPDKGESIMEALQSVARVETEYGGGFVSSVEGLAATGGSARKDWFYYVNGTMPGVGAGEMVLRPGDSAWWDYHQWRGDDFAPAAVGAYPAPFSRGYGTSAQRGTVVYGEGMEAAAREVGAFLRRSGARLDYSARPASFERGSRPAMLFLTFEEAQRSPCVKELLTGDRGAFVVFEGGRLVSLDPGGKPAATQGPLTCAVVSTAAGMGDASPVWFVLCEGTGGVGQALSLLTSGRAGLQNSIGIAVDSTGKVYQVPR